MKSTAYTPRTSTTSPVGGGGGDVCVCVWVCVCAARRDDLLARVELVVSVSCGESSQQSDVGVGARRNGFVWAVHAVTRTRRDSKIITNYFLNITFFLHYPTWGKNLMRRKIILTTYLILSKKLSPIHFSL